jgi:hypothetical protein
MRVYSFKRYGREFFIPANSLAHARQQRTHLIRDMRRSVRVQQQVEIMPGVFALGAAGMAEARKR